MVINVEVVGKKMPTAIFYILIITSNHRVGMRKNFIALKFQFARINLYAYIIF